MAARAGGAPQRGVQTGKLNRLPAMTTSDKGQYVGHGAHVMFQVRRKASGRGNCEYGEANERGRVAAGLEGKRCLIALTSFSTAGEVERPMTEAEALKLKRPVADLVVRVEKQGKLVGRKKPSAILPGQPLAWSTPGR
jgi:hypothetical protein